ncbi:hypothetical protein Prudu_278S000100 [Prunus dulcis]|uniref:Uncharacterized protein n=1 Tax=Prunus dulcis TaxID=3755 RepID=A0A4Y1S0U2_PRUDU|nr:hypothetical protein Prudu_022924 [Prunus dulcis]BBN68093.1 hypothetical protein Prudu_278S000100 [Prunus dulcis]
MEIFLVLALPGGVLPLQTTKRPTLGCESIVVDGGRIWFGVLDRGPFEEDDEFEKVKQTIGSVIPRY